MFCCSCYIALVDTCLKEDVDRLAPLSPQREQNAQPWHRCAQVPFVNPLTASSLNRFKLATIGMPSAEPLELIGSWLWFFDTHQRSDKTTRPQDKTKKMRGKPVSTFVSFQ